MSWITIEQAAELTGHTTEEIGLAILSGAVQERSVNDRNVGVDHYTGESIGRQVQSEEVIAHFKDK